jgi:hypothetical protein
MPLKATSKAFILVCSFNHSKMADVETSQMDTKLAPVNVETWNYIVYMVDLQRKKTSDKTIFCEKRKIRMRRAVEIHILFYVDNSWTLARRQVKFYATKNHRHIYNFIWIVIFFDEAFKYGDDANLWGYVGRTADPFCVEFCNSEQCRILANCLISP